MRFIVRIRISRIKGFSGFLFGYFDDDLQIVLSESGYPGLKDFQDFYLDILMKIERLFLSESGYPGFEDFQDFLF
jgi:hypothetical protein